MRWECLLGCDPFECRSLDEVVDHFRVLHPNVDLPERWRYGYPIYDESAERT